MVTQKPEEHTIGLAQSQVLILLHGKDVRPSLVVLLAAVVWGMFARISKARDNPQNTAGSKTCLGESLFGPCASRAYMTSALTLILRHWPPPGGLSQDSSWLTHNR